MAFPAYAAPKARSREEPGVRKNKSRRDTGIMTASAGLTTMRGCAAEGRGGRSGEVKAAYQDFKGLIVRLTEDTHGGTPK